MTTSPFVRMAIFTLCLAICLVEAHGAGRAGRIDSIAPAAARPGDKVTIYGFGLGGRNAAIMVGDLPATVVSATGHSVTFKVPRALPGKTVVTVANRGGRSGSIRFRVLLAVGTDKARRVEQEIGPAGGTVQTVDSNGVVYSLAVPSGAVDAATTITVTPVSSISNLQLTGGVIAAVRLQPNGLQLAQPATLTFELPTAGDRPGLLGFLVDDSGSRFESLRAARQGSRISIAVPHFSVGGLAVGMPADFLRELSAQISAIPPTLPPSQVRTLISILLAWIDRYGFEICAGTDLCRQAFETAEQSLQFHQTQACLDSAERVGLGNPFTARFALLPVVQIASALLELNVMADSLPTPPSGFDASLDLACLDGQLRAIAFLTEEQAVAQPGGGLLQHFVHLAGDAGILGLEPTAAHIRTTLGGVLETLLARASNLCPLDPEAAEIQLALPEASLTEPYLAGLGNDFVARFRTTYAGCRIRIEPPSAVISRRQEFQFTGFADGLSPSDLVWTLEEPTRGSTVDPRSGQFTAGDLPGEIGLVASSLADPARFKRTVVTIRGILVTVSPATATARPNGSVQFTASVSGTHNTAVTWSADGGSVTDTGLFTAGAALGTFTVTATSAVDADASGTALVSVQHASCRFPPDQLPPGSYRDSCVSCTATGTTVSCSCQRIDGVFQPAQFDFGRCQTPLANTDGVLTCTLCPGR